MKVTKIHIEFFLIGVGILIINLGLYFILSILTDEGNYIWTDISAKDSQIISEACSIVFHTKYYIWFFTLNLIIAGILLWYYDLNIGIWLLVLGIVFHFASIRFFSYYLAKQYTIIFEHQKVSEGYLEEPLISGGYAVGYFLLPNIQDSTYPRRRYAISGIGRVGYTPAIPALGEILRDTTEKDFVRADCYMALKHMGGTEALNLMEEYTHEIIEKKDTVFYQYLKDVEGGEMY